MRCLHGSTLLAGLRPNISTAQVGQLRELHEGGRGDGRATAQAPRSTKRARAAGPMAGAGETSCCSASSVVGGRSSSCQSVWCRAPGASPECRGAPVLVRCNTGSTDRAAILMLTHRDPLAMELAAPRVDWWSVRSSPATSSRQKPRLFPLSLPRRGHVAPAPAMTILIDSSSSCPRPWSSRCNQMFRLRRPWALLLELASSTKELVP